MAQIKDRSRVEVAVSVPADVLAHEDLVSVREAHAAFMVAQEALSAARERVADAEDAQATRDAAIREAVRNDETPPAQISDVEADELRRQANRAFQSALKDAQRAGANLEASVVDHRLAIRALLVDTFREAHEDAVEAQRHADALAAKRASVLRSMDALDLHAARAADTAAPGHTQRHEVAYFDVRRRLFGEYHQGSEGRRPLASLTEFPVEAQAVDPLAEDEYLIASRGQGAFEELRQVEAELRKMKSDDVVMDFNVKRKRIRALEARLAALRGGR